MTLRIIREAIDGLRALPRIASCAQRDIVRFERDNTATKRWLETETENIALAERFSSALRNLGVTDAQSIRRILFEYTVAMLQDRIRKL